MPCEGWLKYSDLTRLEPTAEDSMFTLPVPSRTRKGKRTCLQKDSTPLSSTLPGSQNAFFSFFFTWAGESSRSILESSSEELILLPVSPGTVKQSSPMLLLKLAVNHFHRSKKCFFDSTALVWYQRVPLIPQTLAWYQLLENDFPYYRAYCQWLVLIMQCWPVTTSTGPERVPLIPRVLVWKQLLGNYFPYYWERLSDFSYYWAYCQR